MSPRDVASASTAMISELTAMSNLVARWIFFPPSYWLAMRSSSGPCMMVMPRSARSLMSTTRFQVMLDTSKSSRANLLRSSTESASGSVLAMPSFSSRRTMIAANVLFPSRAGHSRENSASSDWEASWRMRASMAAAHRLCAACTAWMSPQRWRLNSSIGMTWLYPPPAAPPLIPKVGPCDGWRRHAMAFLLRCAPSACVKPTVVVDLPSPRGVGLIPATHT
mmetsp:Transcript_24226/g.57737  ORF Transcript_24226/g.57737 Transcript_24226/m.57737 type:complete len:222 (+) Transcript_24226:1132-1797(+)